MRAVIAALIYPVLVGGSVSAMAWQLRRGSDPHVSELVGAVLVLGCAGAIVLLERVFPYRKTWQNPRNDTVDDLVHSLASGGVMQGLGRACALFFAGPVVAWVTQHFHKLPWPSTWPLGVQLLLALVVGELGGYASHRWMHARKALWRFHLLHHSAERLYWLNATRMHPVDGWLSVVAYTLPLALLGVPAETLTLLGVFAGVHAMLQHANVDVRLGPFAKVLSVAEVHRWHHSRVLRESNANYGNLLLVWDHVFGTYAVPKDREPPGDVGLVGGASGAQGVQAQWLEPFGEIPWK